MRGRYLNISIWMHLCISICCLRGMCICCLRGMTHVRVIIRSGSPSLDCVGGRAICSPVWTWAQARAAIFSPVWTRARAATAPARNQRKARAEAAPATSSSVQVRDRGPYDRPPIPRTPLADNVLLCTADVLLCISRGVKAKLDQTIVDSDCGQHSR